jgi:hypothetical protein
MPDLYLEPYDGPSADEFLDPDRPYQELSEAALIPSSRPKTSKP